MGEPLHHPALELDESSYGSACGSVDAGPMELRNLRLRLVLCLRTT